MSTKRKIASQKKGKARAKSSDEAAGPTEKDIVEALVGESTKVTAEELQTLFGNQLDGIRATARLVKTTRSRGKSKGRVLILPGIMGSKLGRKRLLIDDVIWLGLNDVIFGNLRDLAMGADPRIVPLGVFLSAYFHLKLTLEIAGYDVDYHPFDWRQNIATLGAELKKTVEREATPVALVAHSMGGLVARAAFLQGMNNVSKLIMLGTPNHGSLAPVEALRGQYGLARSLPAQTSQTHPRT